MKGLGPIISWLFMMLVASIPFIAFDARNVAGKLIRANSLLIALAALHWFSNPSGKRPSSLAMACVVVFGMAFLKQAIQRRGIPIIETIIGTQIYNLMLAMSHQVILSAAITGVSVLLMSYITMNRFPIRSHHSE